MAFQSTHIHIYLHFVNFETANNFRLNAEISRRLSPQLLGVMRLGEFQEKNGGEIKASVKLEYPHRANSQQHKASIMLVLISPASLSSHLTG